MDNWNPPNFTETEMLALVHSLHDLRDALMETSLSLQDYLFNLDSPQRREAILCLNALLDSIRSL